MMPTEVESLCRSWKLIDKSMCDPAAIFQLNACAYDLQEALRKDNPNANISPEWKRIGEKLYLDKYDKNR